MEKRKLSPEMRFTFLMLLVAIFLVLGIMNKWFCVVQWHFPRIHFNPCMSPPAAGIPGGPIF